MEAGAGGDPLGQGHLAPLEQQVQPLAIHPAGLVEAVVEVDQGGFAVAQCATDVFFHRGAGPNPYLGCLDSTLTQPPGEHVEEVHAVLDENAAAFGPVPEPMVDRQVLVRSVVLERTVQYLAKY